jgi:hypothetical protein
MEEEMKVEEIKVEEREGEGTKEGGNSSQPPAVPRQPDELPTPLSDKLMQEVSTSARATLVAPHAAVARVVFRDVQPHTHTVTTVGTWGGRAARHVRVATQGGER